MNFLKGSLFRRNTEPEELEPMEESGGGILAVWGSPGCGKTVTAVKIAKHLAAQKKNTVLLLCDMTAPMMPCICPPSELEVDKSLGSIFAAQHISVNLIKHSESFHRFPAHAENQKWSPILRKFQDSQRKQRTGRGSDHP